MAVNIDRGDCVTHPLMPPSAAVSAPIAMHRSSSIDKILPESEPSNGIAFESTNCAPNETTLVNSSQEQQKQTTKWARIKKLLAGVGLTITSAFCFSITTVIVKYMTNIEPSQMALFRYFGILVMSFPITMESKESWFGPSNWWWRLWMFIRSVSGCTSLFFRYSAVTYIPLADATIIILAMPVFVFIFARIFLGEQFGRYHVAALVLSLVGIAFTSKVDTLFTDSHATFEQANMSTILPHNFTSTTTTSSYLSANSSIAPMNDPSKLSNRLIGSLFALGSTTVGSLVYVSVRKMRKTHHSVILFNFALISLVEMCLINVSMHNFKLPSEGYSAYLVMILAVFSFYGQLLLTKALQLEEAGLVSVVRVSGEAFFAFLFQIIFFHELPDQYTIFGAVLVLASVFLMSYRKYIISLPDDSKLKRKFLFLTK